MFDFSDYSWSEILTLITDGLLFIRLEFLTFRINVFWNFQNIEVFSACIFSTVTQGWLQSDYSIFSISHISSTNAKKSRKYRVFVDAFPEICEKERFLLEEHVRCKFILILWMFSLRPPSRLFPGFAVGCAVRWRAAELLSRPGRMSYSAGTSARSTSASSRSSPCSSKTKEGMFPSPSSTTGAQRCFTSAARRSSPVAQQVPLFISYRNCVFRSPSRSKSVVSGFTLELLISLMDLPTT